MYDAFATGEPEGAQALIEGLRNLHPDVPIVLSASGMEPDWITTTGSTQITPLVGSPSGERLANAIEASLVTAAERDRGSITL